MFSRSFPENDIKIKAQKTEYKTKNTYCGGRLITISDKAEWVKLEPYSIQNDELIIDATDLEPMVVLLDGLLGEGHFKDGITGYDLFIHVGTLWSGSFRPKLLIEGSAVLSGRRKRPKLLPMRKAPKRRKSGFCISGLNMLHSV